MHQLYVKQRKKLLTFTIESLKKEKGQKYLFLNIRSLYGHFSEFEIDLKESNIMVFGLVETWLNKDIPDNLINIKGFTIARLDRKCKKRGGGVMLYIRDDLEWDNIECSYNTSDKNIEMLTVLISRKFTKPIYVSVIYVPPTGNTNDCIIHLDQVADYISQKNADWIMGGDLNIDLKSKKKVS